MAKRSTPACTRSGISILPGIRIDGGLEFLLKLVSTRLGHATIALTADRYGHLIPRGDDGAELAAAEQAFLGNTA
ncbi:integrase [Bradyrhizobium japonicum]|jgi:hypothetical protein|uniref:hypothetical protein n=1 Tax=Bradyrhizobium TaxID=374 RepID=UPI0012BBF466|nr:MULTISPECIES: hypothetical protein [Bradyrhizobium]MBR1003697.1 hypothetical protein [Bradyrhizobium liaoningense]MCP1742379.1 integrase [Bradyrhizobium japonicum]MCP1780743.1 integrase [Bradyrhizobium japonicum]MCP1860090.1 integrase [Bradyrhizobium japonicum]MCP1956264.1 integrase [Bradyrhizobium japonicum]